MAPLKLGDYLRCVQLFPLVIHGLNAVAPLKLFRNIFMINPCFSYPRPKRRGPIEALSRLVLTQGDQLVIHGLNAVAPLKLRQSWVCPVVVVGVIHGLNAVAPLKEFNRQLDRRARRRYPRPKRRGPIEALRTTER